MDWVLIWVFLGICLILIAMGLVRRAAIYEFPFLAGAIFLGFIAPQLPALVEDRYMPDGAVTKALVMTILCAGMCGLGWLAGRRPLGPAFQWKFDEKRLLRVAAVFSVIGAFFFYKLSRLPDEMRLATMATGLPVMYLFFAKLMIYGFIVAVLCFAGRPSKFALAIILVDSVFLLDRLIMTGKRREATEFLLAIVLAAFFRRGIVVPRSLALVGAMLAGIALSSTEAYRNIARDTDGPTLSSVANIDVTGNFTALLKEGAPEMRNAALRIQTVDRTRAYDFGLFHYNLLIFNFVPAQIVGSTIKQWLFILKPYQVDRDYQPAIGSTETGMADAFASFWYFGALKFFLIAYLCSRIYASACEGWALPQIIYMASISAAMHIVSHHTQFVVSEWVNFALAALPLLALARIHQKNNNVTAAPLLGATAR